MMSLWDALRMNMMISYQELVRTFLSFFCFCRWDMALPFQQSSIVIPVHPRECGQLIILTRALPLPR
ncbi:hypothetical protein FAD55_10570 [Escherichia coli]|uniref:Uncharacterized protein n=1 Tax=Escherichia coli TaxID=562 RepID=A0A369FMR2_ECOLX